MSVTNPTRFPIALAALALSTSLFAQTKTVTYDLKDVWLLPDITHPRASAQPMGGTFEWTYSPGNFENGVGRFLSHSIPWWGSRTTPPLKFTVETKVIEITMIGNYHGLGLDVSLRFAELSPDAPSAIDTARSKFDIEVGVSRRGRVLRGSVVPRCPVPEHYGSGSVGSGSFLPKLATGGGAPRIGNSAFELIGSEFLGGTSGLLLVGPDQHRLPLLGVTILVRPNTWLTLPVNFGGAAGTPGAGTVRVPLPIPNDAQAVGARLNFQFLAADRGAPQGFASATDGLALVVCR